MPENFESQENQAKKQKNPNEFQYVKNPKEKEPKKSSIRLRTIIYHVFLGLSALGFWRGGQELIANRAKEKVRAAGIPIELVSDEVLEELIEKAENGASPAELMDWASNLPNQSWENNEQSTAAQERVITPNGNNAPENINSEEVLVGSEEMLTPPEDNPFEQKITKPMPQAKASPVPIPENQPQSEIAKIPTSELAAGSDEDPFTYEKEEVPLADKIPLLQLTDDIYSFRSRETVEITSINFDQYLKNYVSMEKADFDLDDDSQELFIAVRDDSAGSEAGSEVFKIFPFSRIPNYRAQFGRFFAFTDDEIFIAKDQKAIEDFLSSRGQFGKVVETSDTPAAENQEN